MVDHKPPRSTGDEREIVVALWRYHRESLAAKLEGVTESDARWSPVGSGTSLLWLVKHLTAAEETWVGYRIAGEPLTADSSTVLDSDTTSSVLAAYRAMAERIDGLVASRSFDALTQDTGRESTVSLRWVVAHLLEETARHAGHADILREMIDGATGR